MAADGLIEVAGEWMGEGDTSHGCVAGDERFPAGIVIEEGRPRRFGKEEPSGAAAGSGDD